MRLQISADFKGVQSALNALPGEIRQRVLASAINKTMDQARTAMTREITREFAIPARLVRERLQVRRVSPRTDTLDMEGSLSAGNGQRRGMNLIHFLRQSSAAKVQARKRGKTGQLSQLQFKIKRNGPAKMVRGAFVGNDGRTVFIRTSSTRLPIKPVTTVGVEQMFNQRAINRTVTRVVVDRFPEIFRREAAYYLSKFNGGNR